MTNAAPSIHSVPPRSPSSLPLTQPPLAARALGLAQVHVDGRPEHWYLHPTTLEFRGGETTLLFGPPACGKSLLCKLLAGLVWPTTGVAEVQGETYAKRADDRARLQRQIGMLFQNNALFDSFTIAQNVSFPLQAEALSERESGARLSANDIQAKTAQALERVGLAHAAHLYPHELSGGMKKRAAFARALIAEPPICIFDEPTAGLDPVTSAKIFALIAEQASSQERTCIVISHELEPALAIATRAVMMHQGRVICDHRPEELAAVDHPAVRQFLGGLNEGPL